MLTNYAKTQALHTLFLGTVYTQPAHLYVGLSTADPLVDGSGVSEPSGNAYARVQCDAWTVNTTGQVTNTNAVNFAEATGNWGAPRFFFVADALTGGNIICRGPIVYPNSLFAFVSDDTADTIYASGNTFSNGDKVMFYGDTLPTGLSGNTTYYVINSSATGDSFQVSLTSGGSAVTGIGDGKGFVGKDFSQPIVLNNTVSFSSGQLVGQI